MFITLDDVRIDAYCSKVRHVMPNVDHVSHVTIPTKSIVGPSRSPSRVSTTASEQSWFDDSLEGLSDYFVKDKLESSWSVYFSVILLPYDSYDMSHII